jgi:hypothetical protein
LQSNLKLLQKSVMPKQRFNPGQVPVMERIAERVRHGSRPSLEFVKGRPALIKVTNAVNQHWHRVVGGQQSCSPFY